MFCCSPLYCRHETRSVTLMCWLNGVVRDVRTACVPPATEGQPPQARHVHTRCRYSTPVATRTGNAHIKIPSEQTTSTAVTHIVLCVCDSVLGGRGARVRCFRTGDFRRRRASVECDSCDDREHKTQQSLQSVCGCDLRLLLLPA